MTEPTVSDVPALGDRLAAHPLLADLDRAHVEALLPHARAEFVPPGRHIVQEGAPATDLHLIETGDVVLETYVPGRGPVRIETLHAGDVLGWTPLVDATTWRLDARVLTATEMIVLDAAGVRAVCDADPATGYALYKRLLPIVVDRLQHTRLRLLDLFGPAMEAAP
jgi:CRP-like cAMP-binding protein